MVDAEEMELHKKIAEKLKALRKAKGITLATFITETGIHIGRIERGERYPTLGTLYKICKYLGISMSELLKNSGY